MNSYGAALFHYIFHYKDLKNVVFIVHEKAIIGNYSNFNREHKALPVIPTIRDIK